MSLPPTDPARTSPTAVAGLRAAPWSSPAVNLVLDARGLWHGTTCHASLAAFARDLQTSAVTGDANSRFRLHGTRRCNLHLAGDQLHEWPCDPALPLQHDTARLAWAKRIQQQYHGASAADWPLAAWRGRGHGITAWQTDAERGSDAVRTWRAEAKLHRLSCLSITPLWRAALLVAIREQPRLARAPHAAVMLVEGELVNVIALVRGRAAQVTRRRLAMPTCAALQDYIDSDALTRDRPCLVLGAGLMANGRPLAPRGDMLQQLGSLEGPLPWQPPSRRADVSRQAAIKGPDFLRPARPTSPWGYLLLAAGIGLGALPAVDGYATKQALRQVQAEKAPAQPPAAAVAHPSSSLLAYPWADVLQAMEDSASEGVVWQALDADGRGRLHIQGQAGSDEMARAVATRLRSSGIWPDVVLARSESDSSGQRFDIQARPRPAGSRP